MIINTITLWITIIGCNLLNTRHNERTIRKSIDVPKVVKKTYYETLGTSVQCTLPPDFLPSNAGTLEAKGVKVA